MNLPLKVQGERAWEGAHLILRIKNTFFAHEKNYSQQADNGGRINHYGIMLYHIPL